MFRRRDRTRLDRVLAAVEIPALGLWLGAACGFAFVFAPAAFRIVGSVDLPQFAALTATVLRELAIVGPACGIVAIVAAILRARDAADRTNDIVRVGLVVIALALVAVETFAIVPQMAAMTDLRSPDYLALHHESSLVYGGSVLCVIAALILAAVRSDT